MRTLLPWQPAMVSYLQQNSSAALFAQMRLGKTICTVKALKGTPGIKLIVCPKSVISSWWDEIKKQKSDDAFEVINYEQLKNYTFQPQTIVLDESVKCKNPKAQITKLLFQQFLDVPNKILLSGNPAPNTPLEYFSQMAFIKGGEWMGCSNWWQFRKRYFSSDYMGYQWFPKSKTNERIKEALSKDAYVLTRKQVGMVSRKVYKQRMVVMPPKVRKIYRKLEKEFVANLPNGKELELDSVLTQLIYLQQTASGFISNQEISDFKVKEVVDLLEGELKGEPVVIWTTYRWEQEAIKKRITNAYVINGDTSLETRRISTLLFNKQSGVMIITSSCGKYGLNLSKASTAIYFSNSYSLDDRVQSEERIFNVNKDQLLLYLDIVTKDSIQEDILRVLKKKNMQSRYFMGELIRTVKDRIK